MSSGGTGGVAIGRRRIAAQLKLTLLAAPNSHATGRPAGSLLSSSCVLLSKESKAMNSVFVAC